MEPAPSTPPPSAPKLPGRPSKRTREDDGGDGGGGGGGGGAGGGGGGAGGGALRFQGHRIYRERLNGAGPGVADDDMLSARELLQPYPGMQHLPLDGLRGLLVVSSGIEKSWIIGPQGFSGLPSLENPPVLLFYDGPRRRDEKNDRIIGQVYDPNDIKQALDAVSPALGPNGGWVVAHCPNHTKDDRGSGRLHAKLLLARFDGFLRVYVGSANFSDDRGVANDIYWVQDFPITRGNNDGLPPIIEDNQPFCSTLRYFLEMLIKCKTGPDHRATLPACLNPLFAGVDFSGARGTLLASVPGKPEGVKEETNGIRGLEAALKGYSWPEGARTQPVVYITGALGKLVKDDATKEGDWVRDFRKGVGAGGKHAPDPDTLIDVRVVWPDNATVFVGDERVARSLGNNCTYYNKKPCPYSMFWKAEAKPGSWPAGALAPLSHIKLLYRVVPGDFGEPTENDPKNEIRAWFLVGSCNLADAAWGELNGGNPTNFELSVLLTTRKPADAAGWLRVIPLKLPRDQSPPGLEYAERYPVPPNGDKFDRKDPRAPFDYAFDKPTVFDGMRAKVLEQVLAAAQAQQQQGV